MNDTNQPVRFLTLEGTHNTRDIGGYATRDGHTVRTGRFFRSDSLHNLSAADQTALANLGLRTVIDLRRQDEIDRDPNKTDTIADLVICQLPVLPTAISDPAALSVLTDAKTLGDVYRVALDHFQEPMRQIFAAIADHADAPMLIHCSAGKDRTGIVIALLLELAGVPDDVIVADYMITLERLAPIADRLRKATLNAGLDRTRFEQMLLIVPEYMQAFLDHLRQNYGSAENYLRTIGLTPPQIERISSALIA